ncbi:hypothetical protein ACFL5Q_01660 [Planctomycetota bacterium]
MTLTIQCGQCGKQFSAPDNWAGRRAKCPKCGGPMEIPAPAANSEPDDFGLELLDEGPAAPPAAAPAAAGPPSNPFAAMPAPPAASGGLGPALSPRKPKKRKTSTEPSIGHTLATFAGSQKLLTAVAVVMGLVILSSLYLLVTSGLGWALVGRGIALVAGAVIVVGGLRGTRRRTRSTDKAQATRVVQWLIVGIVGIVFTFGATLLAAKSGVSIPMAAAIASSFIIVFGIIVVVSGMILSYYVLVLLFPKADVFRIAGWGYVVLAVMYLLVGVMASGADRMLTAAREREAEREAEHEREEFEEWAQQAAEEGPPAMPPGATPPFDAGGRSDSRPEGTSDTTTDRPQGSGRPAGFPGPRFRGPTGPRHGPIGGSGFDARLQQFIDRFGADKVVTVKVQNVSSAGFSQATQGVLTAAGVQSHSASHTGSQATIVVAPVDDVEALAAKLDIGKVTNVDAAKRTITVDAEGDQ